MRVIAGDLKGRRIHAPGHTHTRPTSDRVREALFSSLTARLGTDLGGAQVLDAFAGTGALGIEALSRGASSATFVESDRAALAALRRSIETLGLESRARIVANDVFRVAHTGRIGDGPYSLLFLDPPYRINKSEVTALVVELGERGVLASDSIVVWEYGAGDPPEWPPGFEVVHTRRYGSTAVDVAMMSAGEGTM